MRSTVLFLLVFLIVAPASAEEPSTAPAATPDEEGSAEGDDDDSAPTGDEEDSAPTGDDDDSAAADVPPPPVDTVLATGEFDDEGLFEGGSGVVRLRRGGVSYDVRVSVEEDGSSEGYGVSVTAVALAVDGRTHAFIERDGPTGDKIGLRIDWSRGRPGADDYAFGGPGPPHREVSHGPPRSEGAWLFGRWPGDDAAAGPRAQPGETVRLLVRPQGVVLTRSDTPATPPLAVVLLRVDEEGAELAVRAAPAEMPAAVAEADTASPDAPDGAEAPPDDGGLTFDKLTVMGGLPDDHVQGKLTEALPTMAACGPTGPGTVIFRLTVTEDGRIGQSKLKRSDLADPAQAECMKEAAAAVRFDPPDSGSTVILLVPVVVP